MVTTNEHRNDALYKASFGAGKLVGADYFNRDDVEDRLFEAAETNGYVLKDGEGAARATIKSGLDAGERKTKLQESAVEIPVSELNDGAQYEEEVLRIPAPSMRNDRGNLEYQPSQLVELVRPDWECVALSTQAAHAERVVESIGGDLRYSPSLGWLNFNRRYWERDDKASTQTADRIRRLSPKVAEEGARLFEFAGALAKKGFGSYAEAMSKAATMHIRHVKQIETTDFLKGSLVQAAGHPMLRVKHDVFDQHPWLIGFENGVWDAGEWRGHRREDYLLNICPIAFDAEFDRSEWNRVLKAITGGDEEFARTLQDTAGYILSGASHLRFLPWLYGPKGTGKSTYAELLLTVLGQMAATIDPKKLQARSARERLGADLWNRRLAVCAEAGNQEIEAELLKTLSGADTFTVRLLYCEAFDALPRHVLLMVANDAPCLDAYDDALKDRVVALPFVHRLNANGNLELTGGAQIETVRKDPNSPLVRGFTAWAVEGLARVHQTEEIYRAPCIGEATAQFWADADPLTPFWEKINEDELLAGISVSQLRSRYEIWCEGEGLRPLKGKVWAKACRGRGLVQEHRGSARDRHRVCFLPKRTASNRAEKYESGKNEQNEQNNVVFQQASEGDHSLHVELLENRDESVHSVHFLECDGREESYDKSEHIPEGGFITLESLGIEL